mgnify:CR=1 FL=1
MDARQKRNKVLGERVVKALESRNMDAYYAETKEEAVKKALEWIPEGSTINMGGSSSVRECGLIDAICSGNYNFCDRDKASTQEEKQKIARAAFSCDWFLGSVNAMSEDGVFINIDGNANRVAAYAFGPKNVLLIVGMNKVVNDVEDGIKRVRNFASPPNTLRLGLKTPCSMTGRCGDCYGDTCICSQIVVTRRQSAMMKDRVKVILVGESLGY